MYSKQWQPNLSIQRSKSLLISPVVCACLYVAFCGISLNFRIDIPLLILAAYSIFVVWSCGSSQKKLSTSPFVLYVCFYLLIMGISILFSGDAGRSLRLSAPLLPAVLLFFLIAEYFDSYKDIWLLYLTFALVSLGLSTLLLGAVWINKVSDPFVWVFSVGSPILVVKNDVTFLAIIAPLSLALMWRKPRSIFSLIALTSLVSSILVIGFFQSRVALLTMIISVSFFFLFIKPRIGLACGLSIAVIVLLIDSFVGFPLIQRFIDHWDGTGRIPLWISAWKMFLDAPLLGHGPHTFVQLYESYLQNVNLPSWLFVDSRTVPWPHNLYLEVLAEQGIFGFLAFLFLLISGLFAALKVRRITSAEVRILGYGVLASLMGFCFAALIELTFLRQWVTLVLFTILGVIAHLTFKYQFKEVSDG